MGRQKGISLTQSFDGKILKLINGLIEEKVQQNKKDTSSELNGVNIDNNEEENGDDDAENSNNNDENKLIRSITTSEALRYVVSHDASLARNKRTLIEKSIERVLSELKIQEEMAENDMMNAPHENNGDIDGPVSGSAPTNNNSQNNISNENKESLEAISKTSGGKKRTKDALNSGRASKRQKDRSPPNASLSQLGGMDDIIGQLMELIGMPIIHPEIYLSTGVEPPRGVLLHGPPGCGKTTLANALAGDLQVPFLSISAPSIVSGMSGESEKKVRELFQEAKSLAPCLIFMDEIDAITPKRDGAQREMEKRIVAQLLTCIDELSMEKNGGKPVVIIGATNRPDAIDPALRRAGRFDREICLNVPSEDSRVHILKAMTKSLKIDGELDYRRLAKATPGYVGADLKALATAAGICAIKRIFTTMSVISTSDESQLLLKNGNDVDAMDIDEETNIVTVTEATAPFYDEETLALINSEDFLKLSTIQRFLKLHPKSLTAEQLAPLSITFDDFLSALPTIQPTAKREGFATIPDVSWSNVGALSNIRVELHMAVVQPIKRPELYEKFGITVPGGVLLWGPPGCGKTLLAKAVANESRANFISIKGPELLNKYVGESEKAVRQVFNRARASVPCIIFFDELDALVPKRDTSLSESSSRVVNTLLTELDGLNDRKGIFVIGATNRPDIIDPAMLRPGRLDKTLYVELPTPDERLEILQTIVSSNKTPIGDDVNLEKIARDDKLKYFSGADLAALVREAGVFALKKRFYKNIEQLDEEVNEEEGKEEVNVVSMEDFENSLAKVKASVSMLELKKYHDIKKKMNGVITDLKS
ncbi:putative AAA family ATPase [Saccharomycopsis crataegensis]|uniref:AAA family ATPase n=1 Tax=Saccharomycopsis crataegensis TaxID=43959 RepID=A0AAV5QSC5_9ASCO|nr:putative AAA family ATPase [Saccharomycopsis crataegensis]